ncbi:MAG: imidazole glycerol phosphate synthase subunit HisF [Clostridiales Family XIII bacterium]|nr:imidazole glycerol phosphate synthase subunit HisF [Clostridiales Family XIII bacterium]
MLAKRIIPCLDVHAGRVVKGINFVNIRDVGDPVECAIEYDRQGADEIVFLDITATFEERRTMIDVVRKTAEKVFVPLTVGGGIRTVDDFRDMLRAGADKVAVNSAAVKNPDVIKEAAAIFGSQCVVLAVDAKYCGTIDWIPDQVRDDMDSTRDDMDSTRDDMDGARDDDTKYSVYVAGGREDTGIDLVTWAKQGAALGAGEILLTSMDTDGTKAGFDHAMLRAVCKVVDIPVIASGGGGDLASFADVFLETPADAALAASIFHYGEYTVDDVKAELRRRQIPVR